MVKAKDETSHSHTLSLSCPNQRHLNQTHQIMSQIFINIFASLFHQYMYVANSDWQDRSRIQLCVRYMWDHRSICVAIITRHITGSIQTRQVMLMASDGDVPIG